MAEFQPLSALLAKALPQAKDPPAAAPLQDELARRWRKHAGAAAAHARPLLFASGRVVVFVESASWGNEIRHRAPRLLNALAAEGPLAADAAPLRALEVKILPASPTPAPP